MAFGSLLLTIMPWGTCSATRFLVAKPNSQYPLLTKLEFQNP